MLNYNYKWIQSFTNKICTRNEKGSVFFDRQLALRCHLAFFCMENALNKRRVYKKNLSVNFNSSVLNGHTFLIVFLYMLSQFYV